MLTDTYRYLQILYRHIRELEEACHKAGIPVPTLDPDDSSVDSDGEELPLPPQFDPLAGPSDSANYPSFPPPIKPETFPSLLTNPQGNLDVLGPVKTIGDRERPLKQPNEFLTSLSTACLMGLLAQGPLLQNPPFNPARSLLDGFSLPPRDLADHLLGCFWDRVYCLYPFFDRPSVQDVYESLWTSYNTPVPDRNVMAHTFFLRAKQHIGLDLLEIRSVGVIQTLLMASLYSQIMPDPQRSWELIGVACRIAQGLGIHETQPDSFKHPLELEIQRRTWHGVVSMAYGKPSTTFHLPGIPLPGEVDLYPADTKSPFLTLFYTASIELYRIFGGILSDSSHARCDQSRLAANPTTVQQGELDVIVKMEENLSKYESNLPSCLDWCHPSSPATDLPRQLILRRQRNVLHARYVYLHLLLYRPAFTQICSEMLAREDSEVDYHDPAHRTRSSSMPTKCAIKCTKAAVGLVSLLYDTYQTPTTDTWWHNTFYTSTAGMVLVMSYTCLSSLPEIDKATIDAAWRKCEQILQFMIPFNYSIRNTLLFLQDAHSRVLSYLQDESDTGADDTGPDSIPVNGAQNPFAPDADHHIFSETNWQGSAVAVDGQGFSCPADFTWFQGWLAEELP
ncbi:hypothetical protein BBP40_009029 [Aspergillus hancockii]|nr:hypothetical protein BBP40_009029 [Aspergillus hancockii]